MSADFTKRKFLGFSPEQQHKKCSEILRLAYDSCHGKEADKELLETYRLLCTWMDIPTLNECTSKNLADRYHQHTGKASVFHKEHRLLPHARHADRVNSEPLWDISIYLDNIRSAHNVGSILRTTEAFSLGKVYFSEATPSITHKQVKDAAMGTDKWVESFHGIKLADLPRPIIALETVDTAVSLYNYVFPEQFTLALGNEEYGCSDDTLRIADIIIEIPLRGRKNSLNVANAFAIVAAEISRQKQSRSGM